MPKNGQCSSQGQGHKTWPQGLHHWVKHTCVSILPVCLSRVRSWWHRCNCQHLTLLSARWQEADHQRWRSVAALVWIRRCPSTTSAAAAGFPTSYTASRLCFRRPPPGPPSAVQTTALLQTAHIDTKRPLLFHDLHLSPISLNTVSGVK